MTRQSWALTKKQKKYLKYRQVGDFVESASGANFVGPPSNHGKLLVRNETKGLEPKMRSVGARHLPH